MKNEETKNVQRFVDSHIGKKGDPMRPIMTILYLGAMALGAILGFKDGKERVEFAKNAYRIENSIPSYNTKYGQGFDLFYNRGRELLIDIQSYRNNPMASEDSILFKHKMDSLYTQYVAIKDGIDYILINEPKEAEKILNGKSLDDLDSILLKPQTLK